MERIRQQLNDFIVEFAQRVSTLESNINNDNKTLESLKDEVDEHEDKINKLINSLREIKIVCYLIFAIVIANLPVTNEIMTNIVKGVLK